MAGRNIATATIAASTGAGPTSSSAVEVGDTAKPPGHPVGITAPSDLDGTVTVQVDPTETDAWSDLAQQGSTASVTVPAGGARVLPKAPRGRLRLRSTAAEASDRDFHVWRGSPA